MMQDLETQNGHEKPRTYQLPDVITGPQAHVLNDSLGLALSVDYSMSSGDAEENGQSDEDGGGGLHLCYLFGSDGEDFLLLPFIPSRGIE